MSTLMEDDIKRWTAKRKTALVLEIIQGKTTVAEASRAFDLQPSELEQWVEEGKRGMENALRTNPLDVRQQYEKKLSDLQEAYGEAMLELRARKKLASLLGEEDEKQAVEKSFAAARVGRYDLKPSKNDPDKKDERQPRLPGGDVQLHQP